MKKKNGKIAYHYKNRNISEECFYKDGKKDGELKEYYENKSIKSIGVYRDDVKHGIFKDYYPNGKLKMISEYYDGEHSGICIGYYDDGLLKFKYDPQYDHKYGYSYGNGLYINYHETNNKSDEIYWMDKQYWTEKNPYIEIDEIDGRRYNITKFYYSNGNKKMVQILPSLEYYTEREYYRSIGSSQKHKESDFIKHIEYYQNMYQKKKYKNKRFLFY